MTGAIVFSAFLILMALLCAFLSGAHMEEGKGNQAAAAGVGAITIVALGLGLFAFGIVGNNAGFVMSEQRAIQRGRFYVVRERLDGVTANSAILQELGDEKGVKEEPRWVAFNTPLKQGVTHFRAVMNGDKVELEPLEP